MSISRATIRRLIKEHQEAGAIPVEKLVDLIRAPDPPKPRSKTGKYVVRVYDGFDHCWTDVTGPVPWEEALARWKKETNGGLERVSFADIDYYSIFPSDTRMLYSSESS